MKTLVALLFLPTLSFANSISLDSGVENLGRIKSNQTVRVVRTARTPRKVKMSFRYSYDYNSCVETGYRQVWVPGYNDTVCHGGQYRHRPGRLGHHGHRGGPKQCHTRHIPGHYQTQSYCVRYEVLTDVASKVLTLKFNKASKLSGSQKEVFKITFGRNSSFSQSFKMSGTTASSKTGYRIKRGTLRKMTLKFIAK